MPTKSKPSNHERVKALMSDVRAREAIAPGLTNDVEPRVKPHFVMLQAFKDNISMRFAHRTLALLPVRPEQVKPEIPYVPEIPVVTELPSLPPRPRSGNTLNPFLLGDLEVVAAKVIAANPRRDTSTLWPEK